MTMRPQLANLAKTTIATTVLGISDTSVTVATGDGTLFPSISDSRYYYYLTLVSADNSKKEIVKATARSGDTFTIVRAQGGTTAKAFAAGDSIALGWTKESFTDYLDKDLINVKHYGAAGDGSTVDSSAIALARAAGKRIYWPAGTYVVSDYLSVTNTDEVWIGDGIGKTIITRNGATSSNTLVDVTGNNFEMRGITLDGRKGIYSSACSNIVINTSCKKVTFFDCSFINGKSSSGYGAGFVLTGSSDIADAEYKFIGCSFNDNDSSGFYGTVCGDMVLSGCHAARNGGSGFELQTYDVTLTQKEKRTIISSCVAKSNTLNGIVIGNYNQDNVPANYDYGPANPDSTYVSVANNVCVSNGVYGIACPGHYTSVHGNVCSTNGLGGIWFGGSYGNCNGNVSDGNTYYGIDLGGAYYSVCAGNTVTNTTSGVGINVEGTVQVKVHGNFLKENGGDTTAQINVNNVATDGAGWAFDQTTRSCVLSDNHIVLTGNRIGILVADGADKIHLLINQIEPSDSTIAATKRCIQAITNSGTILGNVAVNAIVSTTIDGSNQVSIPDVTDFLKITNAGTVDVLRYSSAIDKVGRQGVAFGLMTSGGSGYTSAPGVTFTGGGGGVNAAATAYISKDGVVRGIRMTNFGSGYTSAPAIGFTGGGGAGAAATAYRGDDIWVTRRNIDLLCTAAVTFTRAGSPTVENSAAANISIAANGMLSVTSIGSQWYRRFSS